MLDLDAMIESARKHKMTDGEKAAQRTSFAAGNLAVDRPKDSENKITRVTRVIPAK